MPGNQDKRLKAHPRQPAPEPKPVPASTTLDSKTFGKRLRSARKELGWTLAHLAELSGVSITSISRAERGQLALGYENFTALGRALKLDMNAMFAGEGVQPRRLDGPVVTRAGKGVVYQSLSFAYEFLGTSVAGKQMSPVVGTVHARGVPEPADYARHPGEEFAFVLTGEIDVYFETGEVVRLARGDSLYYEGLVGHAYVSVSRKLAQIVAVSTSESTYMPPAPRKAVRRTSR